MYILFDKEAEKRETIDIYRVSARVSDAMVVLDWQQVSMIFTNYYTCTHQAQSSFINDHRLHYDTLHFIQSTPLQLHSPHSSTSNGASVTLSSCYYPFNFKWYNLP